MSSPTRSATEFLSDSVLILNDAIEDDGVICCGSQETTDTLYGRALLLVNSGGPAGSRGSGAGASPNWRAAAALNIAHLVGWLEGLNNGALSNSKAGGDRLRPAPILLMFVPLAARLPAAANVP
jgi:hypothetical protein